MVLISVAAYFVFWHITPFFQVLASIRVWNGSRCVLTVKKRVNLQWAKCLNPTTLRIPKYSLSMHIHALRMATIKCIFCESWKYLFEYGNSLYIIFCRDISLGIPRLTSQNFTYCDEGNKAINQKVIYNNKKGCLIWILDTKTNIPS